LYQSSSSRNNKRYSCFNTTYLQSEQGGRRELAPYSGTVRSSLVEHWRRITINQKAGITM